MSDDGWGNDDGWSTPAVSTQPACGGGRGCHKCGEEGHFARECPSGGGGGGRGDNRCRNCKEEGHMANDCPNPEVCRYCRQEGHMIAECPQKKCFNCRQEGHSTSDCPEPVKCRNCKEEGHQVAECTKPQVCGRCGEEGHIRRDCTGEEKTRQWIDADGITRESYVPKADIQEEDLFNLGIESGINFEKYQNIRVAVTGDNPVEKISEFKEAGLSPLLMENIEKSKYLVPTPVQQNALPIIMAGRDLMACSQTGSGKTAAYLLPILHKLMSDNADSHAGASTSFPQAIVMVPTRELARQINNVARQFAKGSMLIPQVVYGGTNPRHQASILNKGCNILIATPGRLLDYIDKGNISLREVQFFVLDEADRMLDMGFRQEIGKCVDERDMPSKEKRQTLMFSATFPDEIQNLAKNILCDHLFLTIGVVGGACSDVKQDFVKTGREGKWKKLEEMMEDPNRNPQELTLIFANAKKLVDFLGLQLCQIGLPATTIHGDRLQSQREEALYDFRHGSKPILVATAVAARGLDIPNVAHVINYDLPKDVDEYVHRIGRTGRLGNLGKATSFYDETCDVEVGGKIVELLTECKVAVPEWLIEAVSGGCIEDDDDDWG